MGKDSGEEGSLESCPVNTNSILATLTEPLENDIFGFAALCVLMR